MKKLIFSLLSISFLSILMITATGSKAQAQDVTVSYQAFYDELSPYGQWVYDAEYGNVWVPNEGGDFRPYGSRGYWAMTEYGNTWISDDPWGWAVYHYGRWTFNPYYGWIWVPGYEWAPAWVSWRYGHGYCGWAPLSPGYYVGASYGCPDNWWVFLGPDHLYRHDHYGYWNNRGNNHTYIRQTNIINNVYTDNRTHVQYNYGPRASTIEQVTHRPVQVYRVAQSGRPGTTSIQQNTVNIYRPQVNSATVHSARPANVVQAPVSVGRPQTAQLNNGAAPAFRQEMQHQNRGGNNGNTGVVGPNTGRPGNNQVQNNAGGRNNVQPAQQNEPLRNNNNRAEPARNNQTEAPRNNQNANQAEPGRNNQQQNRPEPGRFNPPAQQQQQARPEPPRYNPPAQQQQARPEPPRYNPPAQQQQPRPEPPRNNPPAQQQRPQPSQEQRGGGRR